MHGDHGIELYRPRHEPRMFACERDLPKGRLGDPDEWRAFHERHAA